MIFEHRTWVNGAIVVKSIVCRPVKGDKVGGFDVRAASSLWDICTEENKLLSRLDKRQERAVEGSWVPSGAHPAQSGHSGWVSAAFLVGHWAYPPC